MSGQQTEQNGGKEQNKVENEKISVVATIFPQYDFVRQIAGENVELKMLLKPGEETHSYEPTPQDIIAIQNSDLFIYVGGENDAWVEDILESMPDNGRKTLKLVDCVDTVEEEHVEGMKEERGHDHDEDDAEHEEHEVEHEEDEADHEEHGQEETHYVHEIDEHVWTSPLNAVKIVEQVIWISDTYKCNRKLVYHPRHVVAKSEHRVPVQTGYCLIGSCLDIRKI